MSSTSTSTPHGTIAMRALPLVTVEPPAPRSANAESIDADGPREQGVARVDAAHRQRHARAQAERRHGHAEPRRRDGLEPHVAKIGCRRETPSLYLDPRRGLGPLRSARQPATASKKRRALPALGGFVAKLAFFPRGDLRSMQPDDRRRRRRLSALPEPATVALTRPHARPGHADRPWVREDRGRRTDRLGSDGHGAAAPGSSGIRRDRAARRSRRRSR